MMFLKKQRKKGYEETEVAMSLLGKVPIWASGRCAKTKYTLLKFNKERKKRTG